jgi:hypothetical protein
MFNRIKKDKLITEIQMISKEYESSELNKFELDQLEIIKYLLLAGFKKNYINKSKLYDKLYDFNSLANICRLVNTCTLIRLYK